MCLGGQDRGGKAHRGWVSGVKGRHGGEAALGEWWGGGDVGGWMDGWGSNGLALLGEARGWASRRTVWEGGWVDGWVVQKAMAWGGRPPEEEERGLSRLSAVRGGEPREGWVEEEEDEGWCPRSRHAPLFLASKGMHRCTA